MKRLMRMGVVAAVGLLLATISANEISARSVGSAR
jgi:hypothetical protein